MKPIELYKLAWTYWDTEYKHPKKKGDAPYAYLLANHSITIHRKNDNNKFLYVSISGGNGKHNGTVWEESWKGEYYSTTPNSRHDGINLIDYLTKLEGDDWEFFNEVQHFNGGYIKLPKEVSVQNFITDVLSEINEYDEYWGTKYDPTKRNPHTCGGYCMMNGLVDGGLSFYCSNGIEVELMHIASLKKENRARKYYSVRPLPFDPNKGDEYVYIHTTHFYRPGKEQEFKNMGLDAIKETLSFVNYDVEFIDMNIKKPIFSC